MKRVSPKRQRGAALLALLAVLMLGGSWYLVSRLDAAGGERKAAERIQNAAVLKQAKQALIGYIAAQAVKPTEPNPGAFPCPEAPGSFNSAAGTDGKEQTPSCTLPTVGRFPWRTIGTDKLLDSAGEPLWYVVASGWSKPGPLSTDTTVINSNCTNDATMTCWSGQLTVDGQAKAAVALIIAPGRAFNVPAAAGCTAWNQVRPASGAPDWRNYLECENATNPADTTFVTTGPSGSFNDQVLRITVADVMPAIEAAIANRIEREIVPVLNTVYTPTMWGFSGSNPVYPFAAPFANPGPGIGTSSFQGAAGTYQGLLPFNQTQGCTADAGNPRCLPSLLSFAAAPDAFKTAGSGSMSYEDCVFEPSISAAGCTIQISNGATTIAMTAVINNVASGLRSLSLAGTDLWQWLPGPGIWQLISGECHSGGTPPAPNCTLSATLSSSGAATMRVQANLTAPNPGSIYYYIRLYLKAAGDHPLLDASTTGPGATGWFVRNEWYRLLYYATVAGHTATTLPPSCITMSTCLSVANGDPTRPITPAGGQRAILILAGRSINGSTRPSATLGNYLEFGNATGAFERRPVSTAVAAALKKPFNDRIVVINSN